jgi:hypothetical protein
LSDIKTFYKLKYSNRLSISDIIELDSSEKGKAALTGLGLTLVDSITDAPRLVNKERLEKRIIEQPATELIEFFEDAKDNQLLLQLEVQILNTLCTFLEIYDEMENE